VTRKREKRLRVPGVGVMVYRPALRKHRRDGQFAASPACKTCTASLWCILGKIQKIVSCGTCNAWFGYLGTQWTEGDDRVIHGRPEPMIYPEVIKNILRGKNKGVPLFQNIWVRVGTECTLFRNYLHTYTCVQCAPVEHQARLLEG